MKRNFGQSSQIMLRKTRQVLEPAENPFYSYPFLVGYLEFDGPMTSKFPIYSQDALDALALVLWIRNNR